MKRTRAGAVLLEALLGLAILGIVGATLLRMSIEGATATRAVSRAESEMREASRLLTATTLWSREDLLLRLGATRQGRWSLRIQPVESALFAVIVADSAGESTYLSTVLYRPR